MTVTVERCATCRHHSCEKRARVVHEEGADEMEQLATHDGSPEDCERFGPEQFERHYSCVAQDMKKIGIGDDAGVGCPLWEEGKKKPATEATMFRTPRPGRE
jgi:hypothetical protein